ncbi:MAG: bifunctional 3-deoxy-7-phosphoheptulonate synthase/chorismate mutase type II [Flavobacteriales bacterium]|jgi:chorismate mutase|uniref:bifunctional 3-deoxy-7-phosphoheptulonate synthase/chorismate mutase type II n=1 Tax=Blattabacterium sp. (Mastotermes darwiniensis) TaxID=39768 RepID=UPI000231DF77|nr:bifunctional 3-deoxy-7-phosphoheptulonate synthase/chorismate mutase type II [Blattabacterium sp. (Mastotermes darwiniensis)]AER40399.1 phospho-2-dehydro-3-deoxyheptonate aldolase (aroG)/chorismate mutase (pheA) [Blattabacterium sp. (Mastotermes darwiniensis) str. MADAR]MDR1804880.1 bifunctional 3-deoxy-7-phosphoheptulonate synthase/chorismate mutase type II [Flavobacteriales bacterium]
MEKDILNNSIDRSWIEKLDQPITISGPCSAESEQQIKETAIRLNTSYVQVFRAGIWKPRTKPNNFEGIGKDGLQWLKNVKKNTGLMVATEIANAEHVKLALSFDIDVLWIGARSTASPFTVQEIADSLEGKEDKIVLVKNPIHPDIELWIGALERLFRKGVRKLGVIHRGFYIYKTSKYRNQPNWNLLLNFRSILPRIPVICDPSHICGNKTGIFEIAKTAYHFFKYDGWMIESHCDPDHAWSDAQQQITPEKLLEMLKKLKDSNNDDNIKSKNQKDLDSLRILIDEIDENIIALLAERMKISKKLGTLKKTYNISVLQPNRWNFILNKNLKFGKKLGISEDILEGFFNLLHKESINIQNRI